MHDFDVRTFPDHRQEILELLIELWNDWQPDVVFQPSAARHPPGPPDDRGRGPARVQADDDPRLRDPLEQLRLRLPGVHLARAAPRRAQGRRAREVRLAAAPSLRRPGVRLEPRPHPRDQRQPRVRRGLPGLSRRLVAAAAGGSIGLHPVSSHAVTPGSCARIPSTASVSVVSTAASSSRTALNAFWLHARGSARLPEASTTRPTSCSAACRRPQR